MAVDVRSLECPLCQGAQIEVKYEAARDYLTGDEFKVLECLACRVAFTHPVPENMSRYYPLQYRAYKGPILKILGAFYQAKANGWSRLFPQPGRLLEIGCGPGLMLKSMRDLGWDVMGLERNEHAAGYGRKEYGLQILACDVDQLPPQTFDLIILFQVLEHIQDPKTILASCYQRLNPGGRIVIGVPNFHSWQAEVGKTEWLHLDIPRHLFHFSPTALRTALGNAGFRDLSFTFVSLEHDPYGWVQSLLNRCIKPSNTLLRYLMGLDSEKGKVAISMLLGAVIGLPGLLASLLSWTVQKGAIVSVVATRPAD